MKSQSPDKASFEWPTIFLFIATYILWITITLWHSQLPAIVVVVTLVYLVTLHSSLQHEVIHGHPTPWNSVNTALAFPALGLAVPYERYELLHLQHHRNWLLTDPYEDSESYFLSAKQWSRCSGLQQTLFNWHNTLVGRLVLGPILMLIRWTGAEIKLARTNHTIKYSWLKHTFSAICVAVWLLLCDMSLLFYCVFVAYPAISLLMLRAFTEHLPEENVADRSAVVESNIVMQLLYLNNNFHRVHHDHPEVPWYQLASLYRTHYKHKVNNVYSGYGELFRRYAFTRRFPVAHPFLARD